MNLEQRHRAASTLAMILDDLAAVSKHLSRHFGDTDRRVKKLQRAVGLIEQVKNSLAGRPTHGTT